MLLKRRVPCGVAGVARTDAALLARQRALDVPLQLRMGMRRRDSPAEESVVAIVSHCTPNRRSGRPIVQRSDRRCPFDFNVGSWSVWPEYSIGRCSESSFVLQERFFRETREVSSEWPMEVQHGAILSDAD